MPNVIHAMVESKMVSHADLLRMHRLFVEKRAGTVPNKDLPRLATLAGVSLREVRDSLVRLERVGLVRIHPATTASPTSYTLREAWRPRLGAWYKSLPPTRY